MLYLVDVVHGWIRGLEILTNRLEVDAMVREQGLVLPEAIDELPLLGLLLPAAGRLRGDHLASDASLDAVGTRLLLVATNLALLTENTAVTPGQLDRGFGCNDMAWGGKGEGGHVSGGRGRHCRLVNGRLELLSLFDSGAVQRGQILEMPVSRGKASDPKGRSTAPAPASARYLHTTKRGEVSAPDGKVTREYRRADGDYLRVCVARYR